MFPNVFGLSRDIAHAKCDGIVLFEMVLVVMETVELTGMLPVSIYWMSSGSRISSGMSM
jgi:hypothetical protein